MRLNHLGVLALALWAANGSIHVDAAGLGVNETIAPGNKKEFSHSEEVVLQNGFWAKTRSDVTVRTVIPFLQMSGEAHPRPTHLLVERPPHPDGPLAELTGVPGNGSFSVDIGWRVNLPNPPHYYAVTGIQIEEKRNRPCHLVLWGTMVDPRYSKSNRKVAQTTLDNCQKLPGSVLIDNTFVHLRDGTNQFVQGVQACSGKTGIIPQEVKVGIGWKIKGLKVRPGMVQSGSEGVTPLDQVVENEIGQTNCKDHPSTGGPGESKQVGWTDWHQCPPDQLATGVTLYHMDEKWFTGIALRCKYVRMKEDPPPIKDGDGY